jgi:type III secretory pathway component EscV
MSDAQLAWWISEHPSLIKMIERNPKIEQYLRTHLPDTSGTYQQVDEETWKKIVDQFQE